MQFTFKVCRHTGFQIGHYILMEACLLLTWLMDHLDPGSFFNDCWPIWIRCSLKTSIILSQGTQNRKHVSSRGKGIPSTIQKPNTMKNKEGTIKTLREKWKRASGAHTSKITIIPASEWQIMGLFASHSDIQSISGSPLPPMKCIVTKRVAR